MLVLTPVMKCKAVFEVTKKFLMTIGQWQIGISGKKPAPGYDPYNVLNWRMFYP